MPYRKEKFENGDIVHVILRGVDGNEIFKNIDDYYRGVFSIYEFNNSNPVSIKERRRLVNRFKKKAPNSILGKSGNPLIEDKRDKLVELLAFCFMPNHIHLLARQVKDNGITKFMQKVGAGYAGYFNRKYQRKGHFFQDTFNAVRIETDEQLKTVFAYIHTNSLSLEYSDWKIIRIENSKEAQGFLESYKWSSYLDYIGIKNFTSVTQREFMLELFGGKDRCKEFICDYINQKGELKEYSELFLE